MIGRRHRLQDVGADPDPRFSFANERTFLAWIRTALALVAGGVAIAELIPALRGEAVRLALGLPLIVLGAALSFQAYGRWETRERAMRLGEPLPYSNTLRVLAMSIALLAVAAGLIVVAS